MNDLIKVTTNNQGQQVVSARELYLGLGLNKSNWSRWYPTNIIKNEFFKENVEWMGVRHYDEGNEVQDFAISLEFAKHIAMMARTHKSHEYRNYFIRCEERLKESTLNTSQLSPELQMFKQIFDSVAKQQLEQKKLKAEVEETKEQIQGIRDVVAINSTDWKSSCKSLVVKIANRLGGFNHIQDVYKEAYSMLEKRMGVQLNTRLTNKRRRMADEGICKSRRDKLNYIDVIADDKKLIEGYVSIVKELSIKYGAA